jgi:hypothetical protein
MCKVKKYKNTSNTRIDDCIKKFVEYLTAYLPHEVVACCCGHGKYPMSLIVEIYNKKSGERTFLEVFSNKIIPRTKNFYKRDKEGYYYIPELNIDGGSFFSSQA